MFKEETLASSDAFKIAKRITGSCRCREKMIIQIITVNYEGHYFF